VALAAVGNVRCAADVIEATASKLRAQGCSLFVVDLSATGALVQQLSRSDEAVAPGGRTGRRDGWELTPTVWRPDGIPGLARGPRGATSDAAVDLPADDWRDSWDDADVVLALVEVDPGIDVVQLGTWVEQVVPLVSAGRSTAELLETTGELVRAAALTLPFAMMVGCDETDESLGRTIPPDAVGAVAEAGVHAGQASPR
jgi:hypothetical protein